MNVLYITQTYESVQDHLFKSLNKKENVSLAHYHIADNVIGKELPKGAVFFKSIVKAKGFFLYLSCLWLLSLKIRRYYKDEKIDIIHGNMLSCDGFICRKIAKDKKIPYCVSIRDTDLNLAFLWRLPWLKKMLIKNLTCADAIFFLSSVYRDKLIDKIPIGYKEIVNKKSFVIPNGIDEYYINNRKYKKTDNINVNVNIIFVGSINKRKNLETTISACEILIKEGMNITLNIVGPILNEEYRSLINNCSYAKYYGPCEKEQVLEHLRQSDIFVMPSHTETFGLVYLEAMSQGLPVIYTRGQGFDGQFPDGSIGYAVDDNNPIEIAEKIHLVINNYLNISRNATEFSKKYSWENTAESFVDKYKVILDTAQI